MYTGSGLPFYYEHFAPQDYQAYPQNWSVTQDRRSVIYAANNNGILEYDGVTWRLIPTPSNAIIRSLSAHESGIVYVGAKNDLGYLAPDSSGTLVFRSLLDEVRPEDRDFGDVWGTHATDDGVFFQTNSRIFRWDGHRMHVWTSESVYHTSFLVRGKFYVREKDVGLLEVVGDFLRLVPGGTRFSQSRVYVMVPFGADRMLVGTREDGFFIYDGQTFAPFATEADAYLQQYRLYHGAALPGGFVALATLDGGGTVVVDAEGRLVQVLAPPVLPDGWVNYVFADMQGGLWMALNNKGLLRVDVPSMLTKFDRTSGLEGNIQTLLRHRDMLFVGTSVGLYYLDERNDISGYSGIPPVFLKVAGVPPVNALLDAGGDLMVATNEGLYVVSQGKADEIVEGVFFALETSRLAERQVYVGSKQGLGIIEWSDAGWTMVQTEVGGVTDEVFSMYEAGGGALWVTTRDRHIIRIRQDDASEGITAVRYKASGGLAEGDIAVAPVGGRVAFFSQNGIFRLQEGDQSKKDRVEFYRDSVFTQLFRKGTGALLSCVVTESGEIRAVYPDRVEIATPQPDGTYRHEAPDVLRFPEWTAPSRLLAEENGVTWIGSGSTLVRYDPRLRIEKPYTFAFTALVRRVTTIETNRLVYGGAPLQDGAAMPALDYRDNAVAVEFAAPSYNDVTANEYQYYLEGRDATWSAWTKETLKRYTNLDEGVYHFRVRARNAQHVISREAVLTFQVFPPWYRSWWAYGFYIVGLVGLGIFAWRYRVMVVENRHARQQARELARERVLNERLQQANGRLQEANERLVQVDRLKDEFLANTSHELRTPLTAILGFASILKEEAVEEHQEFVGFIEENGLRLLRTLDALLDLARLRAGTMEVDYEKVDVGQHAADVLRSFTLQSLKKGLSVEVRTPPAPAYAWLDARCLDGILHNLIGNAVKFTDRGTVHVQVRVHDERIFVEVRDTGIGIDEGFMPYLFDEFKQESTGLARSHEGNGLGLAVTYRLVQLMGGDIEVVSTKGEGSVFTVSFPTFSAQVAQEQPATAGGDGIPASVRFVN